MKKWTYMYKTEISGNIPHFYLCCDFLTNQVQQEISHEPYRVHGAPWCSMVLHGAQWCSMVAYQSFPTPSFDQWLQHKKLFYIFIHFIPFENRKFLTSHDDWTNNLKSKEENLQKIFLTFQRTKHNIQINQIKVDLWNNLRKLLNILSN